MSDRFEEIKNIGDAGDSMPNSSDIQEVSDSPVCEMVKCLRQALHCGDHQSLKVILEKLDIWKQNKDDDRYHDYWRVAQLTGEHELKSLSILLIVTSKKPENVRWLYLQDALSVLDMCLCNREIIAGMLAFASQILPVLTMALNQGYDEKACIKSLSIINKMLMVCGIKFAKCILPNPFLDGLVEKIQHVLPESLRLVDLVLRVTQSLLMCGQEGTHSYAMHVIHKLSDTLSEEGTSDLSITDGDQLLIISELQDFYDELTKSLEADKSPVECAAYLTKGRCKKDLLRECLGQPWLLIYCSWAPCGVHNGIPQTFFRKCASCSVVRFCSRPCQAKHWEAGHNLQCRAIAKRYKSV